MVLARPSRFISASVPPCSSCTAGSRKRCTFLSRMILRHRLGTSLRGAPCAWLHACPCLGGTVIIDSIGK